jgi:hypothetical protein
MAYLTMRQETNYHRFEQSINGFKTDYQSLLHLSWTQNVNSDLLADSHNILNLYILPPSAAAAASSQKGVRIGV